MHLQVCIPCSERQETFLTPQNEDDDRGPGLEEPDPPEEGPSPDMQGQDLVSFTLGSQMSSPGN